MSRKYTFKDTEHLYFVTMTTVFWVDVFTRNEYKDIVLESIRYCSKEKELDVYGWVIMTNHVHMIVGTRGRPLSYIMRDLKKFTSIKIIEKIKENDRESRAQWMLRIFEWAGKKNTNNYYYQFWQQHSHPIQLDSDWKARQRLEYIHQNPVRAGFVASPEEWLYSSAIDYYTKRKGLLEIKYLF